MTYAKRAYFEKQLFQKTESKEINHNAFLFKNAILLEFSFFCPFCLDCYLNLNLVNETPARSTTEGVASLVPTNLVFYRSLLRYCISII